MGPEALHPVCPRKTRKAPKLGGLRPWPGQDSLVFNLWVVTKVYQQSKRIAGCAEIVQDLGPMFVCQRRDRFDLKDDFIVTDKIGLKALFERPAAILQR